MTDVLAAGAVGSQYPLAAMPLDSGFQGSPQPNLPSLDKPTPPDWLQWNKRQKNVLIALRNPSFFKTLQLAAQY
jgi:hypothetical protein